MTELFCILTVVIGGRYTNLHVKNCIELNTNTQMSTSETVLKGVDIRSVDHINVNTLVEILHYTFRRCYTFVGNWTKGTWAALSYNAMSIYNIKMIF